MIKQANKANEITNQEITFEQHQIENYIQTVHVNDVIYDESCKSYNQYAEIID